MDTNELREVAQSLPMTLQGDLKKIPQRAAILLLEAADEIDRLLELVKSYQQSVAHLGTSLAKTCQLCGDSKTITVKRVVGRRALPFAAPCPACAKPKKDAAP